jgi:hypothetical protein
MVRKKAWETVRGLQRFEINVESFLPPIKCESRRLQMRKSKEFEVQNG